MKKRNQKSRFRKFINKALLLFITLGLLITLIANILNLFGKVDVLAKRVDKQNTKIEQLEKYNHSLEQVVVKQNNELNTMKFKLVEKPIHNEVHNEEKQENKQEVKDKLKELGISTMNPTTIVVGIMAVLGQTISMLSPAR